MDFLASLSSGLVVLLLLSLFIAFAFEFVNGFHDTANAVATVIYTNSLPPRTAVILSGCFNFLGVILSGIGVAYSIVYLLPVELLMDATSSAGLAMVLSLLLAALSWNLGTWYLGLPSSSSHALIGSILGIGLVHGVLNGKPFGTGVNWGKAHEVSLSLFLSPLVGFVCAAILLLICKRYIPAKSLYQAPKDDQPPPKWIRTILIFTCSGVSFGHGSNDGQKGMGLIMLILIGIIPGYFAVNQSHSKAQVQDLIVATEKLEDLTKNHPQIPEHLALHLQKVRTLLEGKGTFRELTNEDRLAIRNHLLAVHNEESVFVSILPTLPGDQQVGIKLSLQHLRAPIEYVPLWVVIGVALALGIGTMVGWKRIVVTIGEKIGNTHLTYAQGGCAEVTAMSTILAADLGGMPVSTTHVLSSGVAGTMAANKSGINLQTIKKIALAWVFTLPATMALSAIFFIFAKWVLGA
jgi:phosphate/sulfate permease